MADDAKTEPPEKKEHEPPQGAETTGTWGAGERRLDYRASAGWLVLRKQEKPSAEIFSVSYVAEPQDVSRPLIFVFNGGPGASSAYLHLGAAGPQRVWFPPDGSLPPLPARLVENEESWLRFGDLVFVDPVGTGFSRRIEQERKEGEKTDKPEGEKDDPNEYFGRKRDLESLCEFMSRWLSEHGRWGSPILIAGESYGGYRVARLVRMLQEDTGIGLNGAVLISPALELSWLVPSDYDVAAWVDLLPTMAAGAAFHGRGRALPDGASGDDVLREAEAFATGEYATFLIRGADAPPEARDRVLERLADFLGLPPELVHRHDGRVGPRTFIRELLRDRRQVVGWYDTTITATDPFPDREPFEGPDPTLASIAPVYTSAINAVLRGDLGLKTPRDYRLLSIEVNTAWKEDAERHFFQPPEGATDDFRYGMALNPHLQAFVTHGRYDLATPYFASDRLRNLMRLDPGTAARLTVRHFDGGHMFYAWEESRRAFTEAIAAFVAEATAASSA